MESKNIHAIGTPFPAWPNFHKTVIAKNGGHRAYMILDRTVRIELINDMLKPYHGTIRSEGLIFDSEEHYNWFLLRWS